MGVVKTASESILAETVVPSEEANYSVQGHAGEFEYSSILSLIRGWEGESVDVRKATKKNGKNVLNVYGIGTIGTKGNGLRV